MQKKIYLSTFSENALEVIKQYDIGIEFNQFCISKTLDDRIFPGTLAAMEREAVESGTAFPSREGSDLSGGEEAVTKDPAGGSANHNSVGPIREDPAAPAADTTKDKEEGYYGEPEVDEMLAELGIAGGRPQGGIVDPAKAIVHGPFTEIIPAAIDPAALVFMRERVNKAAEGAIRLGLNRLVLHTGYYPDVYFSEWHVKRSVLFWKEFIADKPENFRLYVENVFDPAPDTLKAIVEQVDDPRVKACIDVGHASAVGSDPIEWIKTIGPGIGHFHLHNNDGTRDAHGPLTEGAIDMEQVLCAIRDYCPEDVTFTIESRDCDDSVAWLLDRAGGQRLYE